MRVEAASGSATRGRFTGRGAILTIAVIALLFYLIVTLRTYLAQRDRLGQLERQTKILEQQNSQLELKVKQLHDPAYLERLARECLGMVRPGEIGFIVVPKNGESERPDC